MAALSGTLLDLRAGERKVALLMGANYYLLLLFYYLLKPARDSLFLVELSPGQLPLVYILTALIAAPVTAAYARAGMKRRLDRLIILTIGILVVHLLVLYLLLPLGHAWIIYFFYSWVGVAGGLTTSQFWLQANGVFDAAQAKRIFPILGLGGIAGAFTGGEVTSFLVRRVGLETQDLLLVSAGVLAVAGLLGWQVFRLNLTAREAIPEQQHMGETAGSDIRGIVMSILRSRHLTLTVGIISLTVMTASFVDFQFKTVSWQAYPEGADLTAFLGRFYGRMSLISLLVQMTLAPRLIRWFGVGSSLLVLPAMLAGGAITMFVMPGLLAGMIMRGGDFSLKYSLDKTSRELLFLPIPLALKKRTKVFIDMFVDRWARGLAGGLLLLVTAVLNLDLRGVALVTLVLIAVWMVLAFLMRRAYIDSFREALSRREIDVEDLRVRIDDTKTLEVLTTSLGSEHRREVVYALDMLQGVKGASLAAAVRPLLSYRWPDVRQRAVAVLAANREDGDDDLVRPLLQDTNLETRVGAVAFLSATEDSPEAQGQFLAELLGTNGLVRNATVAFIARGDSDPVHRQLVNSQLIEEIELCGESEGCEGRRVLAGLPWLPPECGTNLWDRLLTDDDPLVVEAAIAGVGLRGDRDRVPWLLKKLGQPQLRTHARAALTVLATNEPLVIADLEDFLGDHDQPSRQRAEIPRALAGVPHQESVDVLVRRLVTRHPNLRYEVLKGLGKLRAGFSGLVFDRDTISGEVCIEAGRYIQLARVGTLLPAEGPAGQLLMRAIGETQQLRLESVFRLLGLLYPAKDLLNAYYGVMSGRRVLRANAQEFLDNLLAGNHRQLVLSLIDEQPANEAWRESLVGLGEEFGDPIRNSAEAAAFLGASCDPWLAACAIFAGGEAENASALPHLTRTGEDMLTPIEKVLLLQQVEIFAEVPTDQLAALAAISREVSYLAGDMVYKEHDLPDALYLMLEGSVRLSQGDRTVSVAGAQVSFGTWALFDDEPRVLAASAIVDSRLLRIDRNEFNDLLSDDVRIAQGIIRTVARKLRELAERAV
ncbi:MAG: Npt1/Npt2 family nucleotide transporter [Candidatus Krumholzibacteria bacterium]|nr:Npt1/Npt2 family nucleotide transporter [Candidatus Krumholzibacteria bacterium]